jgi:type IV pilus assembly protein PilQ
MPERAWIERGVEMRRLQGAFDMLERALVKRVITLCIALSLALLLTGLSAAAAGEGEKPTYIGKRISLDLSQADIGDVLRLIAEVSGLNIIAGPQVKGTVTIRMVDVPWDQALDVLLKLQGLAQERHGNVILIAPLEHFSAQRQAQMRIQHMRAQSEPKVTRVVSVNYADALALKASLEKLIGTCASISVHARTNTLIITGSPSCLGAIRVLPR